MIEMQEVVTESVVLVVAAFFVLLAIFFFSRYLEDSKRTKAGRQSLRWVAAGIVLSVVDDAWNLGDRYSELVLLLALTWIGLTLVEYQILKDKELDERDEESGSEA